MAIYSFICLNDDCYVEVFEYKCSIQDYDGVGYCPYCGGPSEERDLQADAPYFSVRLAESEIKKVGHLARRRGERMSVDEIAMRDVALRTKKEEFLPDEHFKVHRKNES